MKKKLSNEQERAAYDLRMQNKCSQKNLAKLANVSQSTISRAIDDVEYQNVVEENTRLKQENRNLTMEIIRASHEGEAFIRLNENERKRLEDCGYF